MALTFPKDSFAEMTPEQYRAIQETFATDRFAFCNYRMLFYEQFPECPRPKPIERLDLVMRKEFAQEIIAGTKKVEIRAYTPFYTSRLYDKDVLAYEEKHWDNEVMRLAMMDFNDSVRAVKTIHFHDYGKTWFLDVECIDNNTVVLVDDQVHYLQEEYGCHEFDEMLADFNAKKASERPIFFYFAIGKVLGTNLK